MRQTDDELRKPELQNCEVSQPLRQNLFLGSYSSTLLIVGNFRQPACPGFTCRLCFSLFFGFRLVQIMSYTNPRNAVQCPTMSSTICGQHRLSRIFFGIELHAGSRRSCSRLGPCRSHASLTVTDLDGVIGIHLNSFESIAQ